MTANQSRGAGAAAPKSDYYKLLGVPHTATFKEITRAYREAMKRAHPDRHRPDSRAAAEERAKLLNLAFTTLSKADTRRAYDQTIKAEAVQEELMSRYVGGFVVPNRQGDPFGDRLRRERTSAEKADQRRTDRSAMLSIFAVFAAVALFVIALLLVFTVAGALVDALT